MYVIFFKLLISNAESISAFVIYSKLEKTLNQVQGDTKDQYWNEIPNLSWRGERNLAGLYGYGESGA